jgi:hypothetical protein
MSMVLKMTTIMVLDIWPAQQLASMTEPVPATARQLQDGREVLTTELAELAESICFCSADSVVDEHRFHYRHQLAGGCGKSFLRHGLYGRSWRQKCRIPIGADIIVGIGIINRRALNEDTNATRTKAE